MRVMTEPWEIPEFIKIFHVWSLDSRFCSIRAFSWVVDGNRY